MNQNEHLSQIETLWSVVHRAHSGDVTETEHARAGLIDRYGDAVRRYLMASLRDPDAVDDAFQEFSLRFVRGDFAAVSPEKGRFRSYLKTVVFHLIADYGRRRKRHHAVSLEHESVLAGVAENVDQTLDTQFLNGWRENLLHRAWEALRQEEANSATPSHTVLRCRAEHPNARSAELAQLVSTRLAREVTPGNVRVLLHRARDRFAQLLVADVRESLAHADADAIQQELVDLNLWTYCKHVFADSEQSAGGSEASGGGGAR